MRTSHRLLLRLYHDPGCDFARVSLTYVNRGAPGGVSSVEGGAIRKLDAYYFEVDSGERITCIPYHRLTEIRYAGRVVWSRAPAGSDEG